jgi:hypothetical protein
MSQFTKTESPRMTEMGVRVDFVVLANPALVGWVRQ